MKVTVTLLVDSHEHAGKPCRAGEILTLDQDLADWLMETGVAAPVQKSAETLKTGTAKGRAPAKQET